MARNAFTQKTKDSYGKRRDQVIQIHNRISLLYPDASQGEIADALGISRRTLNRYLNNRSAPLPTIYAKIIENAKPLLEDANDGSMVLTDQPATLKNPRKPYNAHQIRNNYAYRSREIVKIYYRITALDPLATDTAISEILDISPGMLSKYVSGKSSP